MMFASGVENEDLYHADNLVQLGMALLELAREARPFRALGISVFRAFWLQPGQLGIALLELARELRPLHSGIRGPRALS